MKKTLLSLFLILGFVGVSHSANLANPVSKRRLEVFPSYPSVDVYVATRMAVAVTSQTVIISSGPSVLSSVIFNTYGSGDSKVEVFNANVSTFQGNPELLFNLQGNATGYDSSFYRIYMDSGVAVNITGSVLPDVTVLFRKR